MVESREGNVSKYHKKRKKKKKIKQDELQVTFLGRHTVSICGIPATVYVLIGRHYTSLRLHPKSWGSLAYSMFYPSPVTLFIPSPPWGAADCNHKLAFLALLLLFLWQAELHTGLEAKSTRKKTAELNKLQYSQFPLNIPFLWWKRMWGLSWLSLLAWFGSSPVPLRSARIPLILWKFLPGHRETGHQPGAGLQTPEVSLCSEGARWLAEKELLRKRKISSSKLRGNLGGNGVTEGQCCPASTWWRPKCTRSSVWSPHTLPWNGSGGAEHLG